MLAVSSRVILTARLAQDSKPAPGLNFYVLLKITSKRSPLRANYLREQSNTMMRLMPLSKPKHSGTARGNASHFGDERSRLIFKRANPRMSSLFTDEGVALLVDLRSVASNADLRGTGNSPTRPFSCHH